MLAMANKKGEAMSYEIFEMMQNMDTKTIETQIALQCAPLLSGLKISNLFNVSKEQIPLVKKLFCGTNISYYILLEQKDTVALFLYQKEELLAYLSKEEVRMFLKQYGYQEVSVEYSLSLLARRYHSHIMHQAEFPHEMGVFLGYPVEDVIGFIEHEGKECLGVGYWKVYKNMPQKKMIFEQFERAKEWMVVLISNGIDLMEAADLLRAGQLYSVCI